jgi:putative redox protein
MSEARVLWTDKDRFLGEAESGHAIITDAGETKTANSPMELLLIGLCGCTASDVVSILRKKREPFTSLEVQAEAERAADFPKVFTSIKLIYRVGGAVSHAGMERAVQLSTEKYCSVSAMLKNTAKLEHVIEYADEASKSSSA